MRGIDRYILRQLSVAMILVTLGLTGVLWLTQSLRFVELTVNKGASISDFMALTLLAMPNFLTVILPVSLFAVVLFTYDKLIADRELVVLRAIGVSHLDLARPALLLAAICWAIGMMLNLWLIPASVKQFHQVQWEVRSNAAGVLIQEGAFNQLGNGITVYVRSRTADGELRGLIVHDRRSPDRTVTIMAERGSLVKGPDGMPQVLMFDGTRQQVTKGSDRLSLLQFDNYAMDFSDQSEVGDARSGDVRELSLATLLDASESALDPQVYRQYRVELFGRLVSPLYCFTFALLAASCLLVGHFNRRGQLDRLALGAGLLVALQAMALGISDLAARDLGFLPLTYIGPLLPALVCARLLLGSPLARRGPPRGVAAS